MKRLPLRIPILLTLLVLMTACGLRTKRTSMAVVDQDRHYYPITQGQELDIQYEIKNTGDNPLFITDIQTSCGCVVVDKSSFEVLPKGSNGFIRVKYNSIKNIGYVKHYVMVYANLDSTDLCELTFDVNVVPDALYTKDYEELFRNYKKENEAVEGKESELGYYVGDLI